MPDAYTQTSSVASDTAAYEAKMFFSLRPELIHDAVVDVKPTNITHRGSSATWFIYDDLAAATVPLSETVDVDARALSDSSITLTPVEYGDAVLTTAKLRATDLLEVDSAAANIIGYSAGLTLDTLARTALVAGTNVRYGGNASSRATVDSSDTYAARDVRLVRTDLVEGNVQQVGMGYPTFIHPKVAYDLRVETGTTGWREPRLYTASFNEIFNGETGMFEGLRFIETSRGAVQADAGSGSTVDVYQTVTVGKEGLALVYGQSEDYGRYPKVVIRPPVDKLMRFHSIGWKWFGTYGIWRQAAVRRVEAASSIGSNS